MRIRTAAEAESEHKYRTWFRLGFGLIVITLAAIAISSQGFIALYAALNAMGYITPVSTLATTMSALGSVTFLGWVFKSLDRLVDERIVGRVRVTYIRTTNDYETRLEAIAAADDEVAIIMNAIRKSRSGSTMESRTNDVSQSKYGYRATTYATVLVAGKPISNKDLLRDGSPIQCTKENRVGQKCSTHTKNTSGLCDEHQQWCLGSPVHAQLP